MNTDSHRCRGEFEARLLRLMPISVLAAIVSVFAGIALSVNPALLAADRCDTSSQRTKDDTVVYPVQNAASPNDLSLIYDRSLPLDLQMEKRGGTDLYEVSYIKFASVNGEKVPGLYLTPRTYGMSGPFPAVVFMCGQGGRKEDVLLFADWFTREGFAVLSLDPQYHGERARRDRRMFGGDVLTTIQAIRQTVIDYRRGLDFLETRPEINQDAIVYIGGSMGGIIGVVVAGGDRRIDAAVITVAGGSWVDMARSTIDPAVAALKKFRIENGLNWDEVQRFFDPVDPINYIASISPRPLLMINGKHDIVVSPKTTKNLWELAGEPKEIWWLDYNHILPYEKLYPDIINWLYKILPAAKK
ncbi:MAG: alpha/beta hydrolase [bacterium]